MSSEHASYEVIDNKATERYEVHAEGHTAILTYKRRGNRITLVHTEVPPPLEGRGIAGMLARTALEDARADGLEVVPLCPYVVQYIRRHQEYLPLVIESQRARVLQGGA